MSLWENLTSLRHFGIGKIKVLAQSDERGIAVQTMLLTPIA
jgi:hypothetical protein